MVEAIYKRSNASFRDAAKIVEELSLSAKNNVITNAELEEIFSTSSIKSGIEKLVKCLSQKDTKGAFEVLEVFGNKGIDFKVVTEELLEHLRVLLLNSVKGVQSPVEMSIEDLEILIREVSESYRRLKYTPIESFPLELVVAKWGMNNNNIPVKKEEKIEVKVEVKKEEAVVPHVIEEQKESVKEDIS